MKLHCRYGGRRNQFQADLEGIREEERVHAQEREGIEGPRCTLGGAIAGGCCTRGRRGGEERNVRVVR